MSKKSKKPNADYEVGFGKPPKATQFKKGQSGNKKGRPKKSRNIKTVVREKLDETMTVREGNVKKRYSRREALALRIIQGAFSNEKQLLQIVFKIDAEADEPEPFRMTEEDDAELTAMLAEISKEAKDENQSD